MNVSENLGKSADPPDQEEGSTPSASVGTGETVPTAEVAGLRFVAECLELGTVLKSDIFDRSPNMTQLLVYLCAKYFEGSTDDLKEYTIATMALGRPQTFDPKKDSLVRVQVHRLRERLAEYYQHAGADHRVHIVLPPGRYVPKFVFQESAVVEAGSLPDIRQEEVFAPAVPEILPAPSVPKETPRPSIGMRWVWIAAFVAVILGVFAFVRFRTPSDPMLASGPALVPVAAAGDSVRILAGTEGPNWTDGAGTEWLSDRYFTGGRVVLTTAQQVQGTQDPRLYASRREGSFRYDIPLPPGVYELRLYFAEVFYGETNIAGFGGEASRIFKVLANGNPILPRLDVTAEVGASTADVRMFSDISPAADGKLHLEFTGGSGQAFVNAIEVTPGSAGKMRSILLAERTVAYIDHLGNRWQPDRVVVGGRLAGSPKMTVEVDPELFASGRYGKMDWRIPVAQGKTYTVSILTTEAWMGPDRAGGGGPGSRVFDIFANGIALVRDLDVYTRTKGSGKILVLPFRGIVPDHHNSIRLSFAANVNYPSLNALRIDQE